MSRDFKIESTVVINGKSFARATAVAARLSSVSSTMPEGALRTETKKLADSFFRAIETGIAQSMGAKKIKEQRGRGLQVDLITVDLQKQSVGFTEVKGSLIQSITKTAKKSKSLSLNRDRAIDLGATLKIGSAGQKVLTTGYSVDAQGNITEQVEELTETEKFYKTYLNNEAKLRAHLKAPSKQSNSNLRKILTALRTNLETKALTVALPFSINNTQTGVTTLKFTRAYLLENASIKFDESAKTINIAFAFPQSKINEALNLVQKNPKIKKAVNSYSTDLAKILDEQIRKIPNNPNKLNYYSALLRSVEAELISQNFTADIDFYKGSILAYKGRINVLEPKKPRGIDPSIPVVLDISQLVQGRTRLRMRRGSGKPYPSKIFERSGTFRESIEAYADFRTNIVNYFYAPYYDSLESYGYEIQDLVEGSIRSITQQRFNRQFNLVKTNT